MQGTTRRQFIRTTGGVVASATLAAHLGWVSGCGSESADAWDDLAGNLDGQLLRPGDGAYAGASRPYNLRYSGIHPSGVAVCAGDSDVQRALRWARENGVPVAVRSGGHNYAGYSTGTGLVIDLGRMRAVEVDDSAGLVRAEPGARNTMIYAGLEPHGVAISAGRCPTVAVGGLVLGGGIGFSSRKLGLTCDHLIEAEVVTASGDHLRASATENPDLFWALRGGGGGNFGICTSFTFETRPVGDVGLYDIEWEWDDATEVFATFQEVIAGAPDEFSARIGVGRPGGAGAKAGAPVINALGQYFGPVDELRELLDPALRAGRTKKRLIARKTFWEAKEYFFANVPNDAFAVKSDYLDGALSDAGFEELLQAVERWPGSSNPDGAGAALFASGGAINRPAADATAFVHRDQFALLATETTWTPGDAEHTVAENLDWIDGLAASLRPYVTGSAYQNFIDPSLDDWQRAYYGSNFDRLVQIKQRYDPDGVFKFQQSIPLEA